MEGEERASRKRPIGWIVLGLVLLILAGTAIVLLMEPTDRSYRFVTVDHPVNIWSEKGDRCAYFSIGKGKTEELASKARGELLPLGFTEDKSQAPWFRFVKGNQEVIVCRHADFAVSLGGKLERARRY